MYRNISDSYRIKICNQKMEVQGQTSKSNFRQKDGRQSIQYGVCAGGSNKLSRNTLAAVLFSVDAFSVLALSRIEIPPILQGCNFLIKM